MRRVTISSILVVAWLLGPTALAHEGGVHAKGVVQEVTSEQLMLHTTDGKMVTLPLTSQTHIMRGGRMIKASDIEPGERAVVHSASRKGRLVATEVRVSAAK